MIKNITIYGTGGVGGYFGGKMINNDKEKKYRVSLIARGRHLESIKKNGLTLKSEGEENSVQPETATDNIGDIDKIDLILLCVKSYDLPGAVKEINKVIDETTVILPLLNGIDIYERIRAVTKKGIVFPACVYVGTHIESPGVIFQKGGEGKILFGKNPDEKDYNIVEIKKLFDELDINYSYTENPYPDIWTKYIFISAYGLVTAASAKTLGEVYDDDELKNDVKNIMAEIKELAGKKNVILADDIVQNSLDKAKVFPHNVKTSFHRDVEKPGKQCEKDIFGETLIRMGNELGVKVDTVKKYFDMIIRK